jgi:hypothetical protein
MKAALNINITVLRLFAVRLFVMIPATLLLLNFVASHTATIDVLFSITKPVK